MTRKSHNGFVAICFGRPLKTALKGGIPQLKSTRIPFWFLCILFRLQARFDLDYLDGGPIRSKYANNWGLWGAVSGYRKRRSPLSGLTQATEHPKYQQPRFLPQGARYKSRQAQPRPHDQRRHRGLYRGVTGALGKKVKSWRVEATPRLERPSGVGFLETSKFFQVKRLMWLPLAAVSRP